MGPWPSYGFSAIRHQDRRILAAESQKMSDEPVSGQPADNSNRGPGLGFCTEPIFTLHHLTSEIDDSHSSACLSA